MLLAGARLRPLKPGEGDAGPRMVLDNFPIRAAILCVCVHASARCVEGRGKEEADGQWRPGLQRSRALGKASCSGRSPLLILLQQELGALSLSLPVSSVAAPPRNNTPPCSCRGAYGSGAHEAGFALILVFGKCGLLQIR